MRGCLRVLLILVLVMVAVTNDVFAIAACPDVVHPFERRVQVIVGTIGVGDEIEVGTLVGALVSMSSVDGCGNFMSTPILVCGRSGTLAHACRMTSG